MVPLPGGMRDRGGSSIWSSARSLRSLNGMISLLKMRSPVLTVQYNSSHIWRIALPTATPRPTVGLRLVSLAERVQDGDLNSSRPLVMYIVRPTTLVCYSDCCASSEADAPGSLPKIGNAPASDHGSLSIAHWSRHIVCIMKFWSLNYATKRFK